MALHNLYADGKCSVVHGGSRWPGFAMQAGIRQGCPLAPITFAGVMDLLLRFIRRRLPQVFVRAFADDIGLVLGDVEKELPELAEVLREFSEMSGMEINLTKTVGIPLTCEAAELVQVCRWEECYEDTMTKIIFAMAPDLSRLVTNCLTQLGGEPKLGRPPPSKQEDELSNWRATQLNLA